VRLCAQARRNSSGPTLAGPNSARAGVAPCPPLSIASAHNQPIARCSDQQHQARSAASPIPQAGTRSKVGRPRKTGISKSSKAHRPYRRRALSDIRAKSQALSPESAWLFYADSRAALPCKLKSTMTELKKGQPVKARTIRGTATIAGKVQEIIETTKGLWVTVQPDAKDVKPFKTRPALCTPV